MATPKHINRRAFLALSGAAAASVPTTALADEEVPLNDETVAEGTDVDETVEVTDDVTESPAADESGVGLIVAELAQVELGETQNIAVLGEDSFGTLASVVVTVGETSTGQERDLPSTLVAENAALVPFAYDDAVLGGEWRVEKAQVRWEDGSETAYVPQGDGVVPTFAFLTAGVSRDEQNDSSAEDPAYVAQDADGNVVKSDTIEEAAQVAEETAASEDATMTAAVFSASAVRVERIASRTSGPVALDPGHGGTDSGATGNGLRECDLNWKIVQYCAAELQAKGYDYYITVTEAEFKDEKRAALSRKERIDRAWNAGCQAVVSFHINSGGGTGALVIVPTNSTLYKDVYQDGQAFGNSVLTKLQAVGMTGANNRLLSSSDYDGYGILLYSGQYGILGVIIEHGFIDNASDAAKFKSETALKNMGVADAQAIMGKWPTSKKQTSGTPIMGSSSTNREGMARWFAATCPSNWSCRFSSSSPYYAKDAESFIKKVYASKGVSSLKAFAYAVWDQATSEGVRPEVLLAQVIVETGWLKFGGDVQPDQCNFGGLGATGNGVRGESFSTVATGLLAQSQHLKGYATSVKLNNTCVDGRYKYINPLGKANDSVEGLAGTWAADKEYGTKLVKQIGAIISGAGQYGTDTSVFRYQAHQQSHGWESVVSNGEQAGYTGQSKRLEAFKIWLPSGLSGAVSYSAHVQDVGWQPYVSNGAQAGSTGQQRAVQAIKVKLDDKLAKSHDVWYQVHCQSYGWTGWAKNGAPCGTQGLSKRAEAIRVKLVAKGSAAPGSTANAFRPGHLVSYQTHVQDFGWQSAVYDGAVAGTTGQSRRLEGLKVSLAASGAFSGSIQYQTHVQTYGWESAWKKDGELSGTAAQSKRLEAVRIKLTGEIANVYDVYYRTHRQTFGWSGWAKNGQDCGTSGLSKRLEAFEVRLVPKGGAAPGSTSDRMRTA